MLLITKSLIVLILYMIYAYAELKQKLPLDLQVLSLTWGRACAKREGISAEQVMLLRNGKLVNVTDKIKCFTNCFLQKIGVYFAGKINSNVLQEKLGPVVGVDHIKAVQAKCDSTNGTNNCDTAFKILECYHQYDASTNK